MGGTERALTIPRDAVWIAFFTLLALALGCFRLGDKGLWVDEAVSLHYALSPPASWLDDNNMALFYALLAASVRLFGDGEAALRLPSVLAFAACVPLLYAFVARAFAPGTARVACALFVCNAFLLHFAQEARGYMLAVLLVIGASYALLRLAQEPRGRWALLYGVSMGLALYAHAFALWVLGAQLVAALWLCARTRRWPRQLALAFALAALFAAPLSARALGAGGAQISWIKPPSFDSCALMLAWFAGDSAPLAFVYGACWLLFLAELRAHWSEPAPRLFAWVLVASWFLLPLAATLSFSVLITPIAHPKYLLVALPALITGVAAGSARLGSRTARAGGLLVMLALSGAGLKRWYGDYQKEQWREVVAFLAENLRSGDVLALDLDAPEPFDYYAVRTPAHAHLPRALFRDRASGSEQEGAARVEGPAADARLSAAARVWLVRNRSHDATLAARIGAQHVSLQRLRFEPRDGDQRSLFARGDGRIIYLELFARSSPDTVVK